MTELQISLETIEMQFKNLQSVLSGFSKETKVLQDDLKLLHKTFRQSDKLTKSRKKKPQTKLALSGELESFLSLEQGTKLTKAEVMKSVSNYIKEKDLQIKSDKRKFLPNKDLTKLFGIKKAQNMTFVEINKHVSHHLSK